MGAAPMDAFQKQSTAPTGQSLLRSMLIAEDDERLMQCLARAMEARGFHVMIAGSVFEALAKIQLNAVVDMRFGDGCGLDVVAALKQQRPDARAIILTGYDNIATAVQAVKLGAIDYLTKPVNADDIVSALASAIRVQS
jgi:two-component system response regulator RegA